MREEWLIASIVNVSLTTAAALTGFCAASAALAEKSDTSAEALAMPIVLAIIFRSPWKADPRIEPPRRR
jgi:hypothetical protein